MTRFLHALLVVAALAASVQAEDAASSTQLISAIRVPSNLGFSTDISPDAQAATIIFENLTVEVDPARSGAASTHNQTAIQTKVATLNIPYKADQRSVTMRADLRGFASVESPASARLVACVGNTIKVVALSAEKPEKVELKGKCKFAIAEEHPDTQFGDWQDRIEFTVQTHAANPILQVTLFLLVEHNTDVPDAGGALLAVDSLDIEIAKPAKANFKR